MLFSLIFTHKKAPAMQVSQSVKNNILGRLTEVKGAPKTNRPDSSAYTGTVESGLCSKSKCLAEQALFTPHPSKIRDFCHLLLKEKAFLVIIILRFDGLGVL